MEARKQSDYVRLLRLLVHTGGKDWYRRTSATAMDVLRLRLRVYYDCVYGRTMTAATGVLQLRLRVYPRAYSVNFFTVYTVLLSPASMLSIGVHSPHAAFNDPQLRTYSTAMTIPPFWLLYADYFLLILGIQCDNFMVIIYVIPQMLLTILTVQMPFYKICRYSLTILWIPFDYLTDILDDATEKLRITDAVNFVQFHVTCIVYQSYA